jgi:hypothetical protein
MGRCSGDRGSATAFLAVAVMALLLMAGLVVDGGGKVRAAQRADRIAAEAGRAAGQQIDLPLAVSGERPRVAPAAAVEAARAYLRQADVTGEVAVSADRREITIEVTTVTSTVFLGLVGVDELTAHGSATVELVRGIREEL